jgi:hypothetical protein
MNTICYPRNNNSFAVDDWKTVGVSRQGAFTSAVPIQRAPKQLVTFAWSLVPFAGNSEQVTPEQAFRAASDSLFEHSMTRKEAAYFRRAMKAKFTPLTSKQTRLLPPRTK